LNVILIILDSLRRDHCGFHGNEWIRTPNLDSLAEQSVIFEAAFPESLPTLPVRRALHTGHRTFPFRNWIPEKGDNVFLPGWQRIPEDQYTVAEVLHNAGYATAFITDTYHQFKPSRNYHRGFDQFVFIRGQERDRWQLPSRASADRLGRYLPERYKGTGVEDLLRQYLSNTSMRRREEDYFAPQVFFEAMQWLEGARGLEPFFLVVDSFDPHEPWDPPAWYSEPYYEAGKYTGEAIITPKYSDRRFLDEAEQRYLHSLYCGEVTMVDKWVGNFLDKAERLGMLENTLVILVSDHGHSIGDHGVYGKVPKYLYPELVDIPLLVKHPSGALAGKRVEDFVYNFDVVSTIYALTGLEPPEPVEGVDLWKVAQGASSGREFITTGFNDYFKVRTRKWALVVRRDGQDARLFDLEHDPDWNVDVAADNPKVVEELYAKLLEDAGGEIPDYTGLRAGINGAWYTV